MSIIETERLEIDPFFRPGDHILVDRIAFDHHAIFLKWVNSSSHLALLVHRKSKPPKIELEELDVRKYRVVSRPADPASVVQRALYLLNQDADGYNLFVKNCEHFCTWCISGDNTSTQIRRGLTMSTGKALCLHTGKRGFGIALAVTEMSFEACRKIRAYMDGFISKSEVIRSIATHAVGVGGAGLGVAIGAKVGSRLLRGLGPQGMLIGGIVGGIGGAFAGQKAGSNVAQRVMDHFDFGPTRAKSLRNAFATLGVDPSATNQEINHAYRRLARAHHPDRGGSKDIFQKVGTAMEIIRAARAEENEPFPCGTRVKAKWKQCWFYFLGCVAVAHGNQTYDIQYDDGDHEESVDIRYIRPLI